MIPLARPHAIYHRGKHSTTLYVASIDNALKLVEEAIQYFPAVIARAKDMETKVPDAPVLVATNWLTLALQEVLDNLPGAELRYLRSRFHGQPSSDEDTRPVVQLDQAWQQELVLFLFEHKLGQSAKSLQPEAQYLAWNKLSFLAPARERLPNGLNIADESEIDGARELNILRRNTWKETAQEANVISRYLQFLNEWGDGNWDLLALENA